MTAVTAVLAVIAVVLSLPAISDLLSIAAAGMTRARVRTRRASPPRLVFLVPAYNEELLVGECVGSLKRMRYPAPLFSVVVIADNCTDRTAEVARAAGAECLVRHDPDRRGKPHAIAWALQHLPPGYDAVVIVDADTVVDEAFAAELANARPLADKAVQVRNGVSNPTESAITRMAAVLAGAKFEFALPLKRRAGLNVPMGAGSCIGASVLGRYGWQAFSIGEDWEMYALLTIEGVEIDLAPRARLFAQEARSLRQVSSQRRRWAAGRLAVLGRYWKRIVSSPHIGIRQKLDTISELLAPGPVVHLSAVALLTGAAILLEPGIPAWALFLCWLSLARPVVYCVAALTSQPRPLRTIGAFCYLPVYAVWRLGVEASALMSIREKAWIRTGRHVPTHTTGGSA